MPESTTRPISRPALAAIVGVLMAAVLLATFFALRRPPRPLTIEEAAAREKQAMTDLTDAEQRGDQDAAKRARARVHDAEQALESLEHGGAPSGR
jgi:hypothetical protein